TELLVAANLPVQPPSQMSISQFLQLMARDKKVLDGQLRLVLLKKLGEAFVTSDVELVDVSAVLAAAGVQDA
ncbi:MAG: 3-dehydroquinate synthase, partial [Spongiibacteraceae bacterium]